MLSEGDIWEVATDLEPGSSAAVMAFEHTWMKPLRDAIADSGGFSSPTSRCPGARWRRSSTLFQIKAERRRIECEDESDAHRCWAPWPGPRRFAGTATAVAGNVAQKQGAQQQAAASEAAAKQAQAAEMAAMQAQVNAMQAQPPAAPAAAPAGDLMAQLQQLASMHQAGILSEAEFTAAKAKLLG